MICDPILQHKGDDMMKKTISIFVVLTILICLLSSCSKAQDERGMVVEEFLTAYQSLDTNAGQYLMQSRDEGMIEYNGIQKILAEKMVFSVGKVHEENESTVVSVTITTVDVKLILEHILSGLDDNATSESIVAELYETAQSTDAQTRTFNIEVPIYQDEDGYKVVLTSELSNALFGGYNEYLSELTGGNQNEQKN